MYFFQKIYYNDLGLILTTNKDELLHDHPETGAYRCFEGASPQSFTEALQYIEQTGAKGAMITGESSDALLNQLHNLFHTIHAGGGLVFNEQGAILMIFRRGKWDLPKGKMDKGEKIDECALREVSEETGLQKLTLDGKICDTYHIYFQKGEHILKHTAWYKMRGYSADTLLPQKEEDIFDARWISETALTPFATQTYEAVKDVLKNAELKW